MNGPLKDRMGSRANEVWKKQIRDYPLTGASAKFGRETETVVPLQTVSLSTSERPIVWLDRHGDSLAAEEYRVIRTRLLHYARHNQVILLASAWPGDGKTTNAINVAGMMALKAEETVLLLDGDMRRSNVSRSLGIPQTPGLSDVLEGSCTLAEAVLAVEGLPNLHILPSGSVRLNPAELLTSEEWPALCAQARASYRWVIIDSPPVASFSDYELLEKVTDGIILILRPDHTKRHAWSKANEMVDQEKVLGVIMNCARDWFGWKSDDYSYYYRKSR